MILLLLLLLPLFMSFMLLLLMLVTEIGDPVVERHLAGVHLGIVLLSNRLLLIQFRIINAPIRICFCCCCIRIIVLVG